MMVFRSSSSSTSLWPLSFQRVLRTNMKLLLQQQFLRSFTTTTEKKNHQHTDAKCYAKNNIVDGYGNSVYSPSIHHIDHVRKCGFTKAFQDQRPCPDELFDKIDKVVFFLYFFLYLFFIFFNFDLCL